MLGCWDVGCWLLFDVFFVFSSISILALAVVECISGFSVCLWQLCHASWTNATRLRQKVRLLPCEIRLCDVKHKGLRIFMFVVD